MSGRQFNIISRDSRQPMARARMKHVGLLGPCIPRLVAFCPFNVFSG